MEKCVGKYLYSRGLPRQGWNIAALLRCSHMAIPFHGTPLQFDNKGMVVVITRYWIQVETNMVWAHDTQRPYYP